MLIDWCAAFCLAQYSTLSFHCIPSGYHVCCSSVHLALARPYDVMQCSRWNEVALSFNTAGVQRLAGAAFAIFAIFWWNFYFSLANGGTQDAVPTTINYTPDSPDLDERRGQPLRSAMARSRPGGTAYMITVTSAPSKFNCQDGSNHGNSSPTAYLLPWPIFN